MSQSLAQNVVVDIFVGIVYYVATAYSPRKEAHDDRPHHPRPPRHDRLISNYANGARTRRRLGRRPNPAAGGRRRADRLIDPQDVEALAALAAARGLGFAGNWVAATIRSRAGQRLDSPALIADGAHARADAYVSLAVVASAAAVAAGLQVADPVIGLGITLVILRIAWESWRTVRGGHAH
jgi:hypothetical protein